jgi:protein-tyrosine phosphatase
MAEGIFNSICEKEGLPHRAASCGTAAFSGGGTSPYAIEAARGLGADISGHYSRHISKDICRSADRIYCMSDNHAKAVFSVCPEAKDKTAVLDPPIPDPYGGGTEDYRSCAAALEKAVKKIISEIGGRN